MAEDVYIGPGDSDERSPGVYEGSGFSGGGSQNDGGRDESPKALDYPRILALVAERFESGGIARNRPHLIGLIIGRPSEPLLAEQIIPSLGYWHHRTATYVDFFCVGFTRAKEGFDEKRFAATLRQIESKTNWTYSGGTDLMLVNASYEPGSRSVKLDYREALAVTLENVIKVDGYERLSLFFERIIQTAKGSCGEESPGAVSDALGGKLAISALKGLVTSLLPESVRQEARDAFLFAVRDVSKRE